MDGFRLAVFALLIVAADEAARHLHVPRVRGRPATAAEVLRTDRAGHLPAERRRSRRSEQTWVEYTVALARLQLLRRARHLPASRGCRGICRSTRRAWRRCLPDSSFNTAVSFTTNTNWQGYVGESTMSYFTQMAGLAWHNFTSAAAGIGVALVIARGLTRQKGPDGPKTVGNFWVDLNRSILYVLLPISIVFTLLLVSQGVIQNLSAYLDVTTLEGGKQTIALGPWPRKKSSRSSAPTAAASSTPTARILSRTRRRSPT